jgi:hypothetical protein
VWLGGRIVVKRLAVSDIGRVQKLDGHGVLFTDVEVSMFICSVYHRLCIVFVNRFIRLFNGAVSFLSCLSTPLVASRRIIDPVYEISPKLTLPRIRVHAYSPARQHMRCSMKESVDKRMGLFLALSDIS